MLSITFLHGTTFFGSPLAEGMISRGSFNATWGCPFLIAARPNHDRL
jgi:hypothetical protein